MSSGTFLCMLCSDIGWLTGGPPRKFRKIHAGLLERVQVAEQVPWWGYATSVAGAGGCGPIKCFKKACAVKAQGSLAQRGRRELHPFSTSLSALRNARRRRRISSFYAKRLKSKSWKTVSSWWRLDWKGTKCRLKKKAGKFTLVFEWYGSFMLVFQLVFTVIRSEILLICTQMGWSMLHSLLCSSFPRKVSTLGRC